MIRIATLKDIPRIVELGTRSMLDGPYAGKAKDNPEQSALLARHVIENIGRVLLWIEDSQIVGLLGFIVFDHHFTGEKTAQEIMWYVLPEHRPGGAGMQLYWESRKQAKEMGAKVIQFSAPNEQVGAIYKRFGLQQMEVLYQGEL